MEQRFGRRSRLPLHESVDLGDRVFFADGCDVEIDHRGGQESMAQILLDQL